MPIFNIHLTSGIDSIKIKEMYKEVSEVIAKHQQCSIDAVSGFIIPLESYQMGSGNKTWEEVNE